MNCNYAVVVVVEEIATAREINTDPTLLFANINIPEKNHIFKIFLFFSSIIFFYHEFIVWTLQPLTKKIMM